MPTHKQPESISEYEFENPVDRFAQIPEPTRKWIEQLREDDINDLNEAIKFYHDFKNFGKFTKWLIISVVAVFVTFAQFGEAIQKIWGLLRGGGHQ